MQNNVSFETITTGQYEFLENNEVSSQIREAGKRTIFFVEGKNDKLVFEVVFKNENYSFINAGNCRKVRDYIKKIVQNLAGNTKIYGIVDRDFYDDEERNKEMSLPKYNSKLWIHDKNTLENYFIDKDILFEYTKTQHPLGKEIDELINEAFSKSKLVQAGNNYMIEKELEKVSYGIPNLDTLKLKCGIKDVVEESKLMGFYNMLEPLTKLDELNKYINGKIFFHHFKDVLKNSGSSINLEANLQNHFLVTILLTFPDKVENLKNSIKCILN